MAWRSRAVGAAFGAAAISAVGLTPALAADQVDAIDPTLTEVTVFNINDFHGRIDGGFLDGNIGRQFACTLLTERDAAGVDNSVFLSAGDNIGATVFASSSQQDNPTIDFLSVLGLEATAVGNHEFDRGFDDLTDRVIPRAGFDHLGANVYLSGTTTPALDEYYITTANGVRIAVIGAVTADTPSLVDSSGIAGITFGDPVDAVNRVAAEIEADDLADIIIAQYHEGAVSGEGEGSSLAAEVAGGGIFADIVNDTTPLVDAIFTGHTHKQYAWDGPTQDGTRPVIQSNSYGTHLGVVEFGIDAENMVIEYTRVNQVANSEAVTPECEANATYQEAASIIAAALVVAQEVGSVEVGEITADITTAHIDGARDNRQRESTLGNLTAQVWLEAMNAEGRTGADIGIMNPGGLRAELLYGDDGVVTFGDVATVHPFANTLQTIDITGAQVVTLLEQQWQPDGASRPFLKLGLSDNVRYTFNPDAAAGSRITGVWVDGAPIDLSATYTIASGSFLISGGDNFTILREGTRLTDSGLIDTDAFVDWFEANSPVSPNYEKNGVAVTGVELPIVANAGAQVTFTVSGIDLTSLGAPANTAFTIWLGETEVGTAAIETVHLDGVPTRDGRSTVSFTVPKDFAGGPNVITLVAEPSGTTVKLLAEIIPAATGPVVETDIPAGSNAGSMGLLTGLAVALAAAVAVGMNRRRQAINN